MSTIANTATLTIRRFELAQNFLPHEWRHNPCVAAMVFDAATKRQFDDGGAGNENDRRESDGKYAA